DEYNRKSGVTNQSERRTEQVRKAQRAYRERKENHVKSLEEQLEQFKSGQPPDVISLLERVASLEKDNLDLQKKLQIAESLDKTCPNCEKEQKRANDAEAPSLMLEISSSLNQSSSSLPLPTSSSSLLQNPWTFPSNNQHGSPIRTPPPVIAPPPFYQYIGSPNIPVSSLQQSDSFDHQPLPVLISSSTSSEAIKKPVPEYGKPYYIPDEPGPVPGKIKSAVEVYGPPDIDYAWKDLKSLDSLKDNIYVDMTFRLFLQQVHCTDRTLLKNSIIKAAAAKYKILNGCSLLDRSRAMEIMDQVQLHNKQHVNHVYYNSSHMQSLNTPADAPFKEAIAGIPSLKEAGDDIDELCALFWTQTRVGRGEEREAVFFKMIDVFAKLLRVCKDEEDRTKFLLATEIGRELIIIMW
ncbi:hypothetical protein BCR33DRAFT_718811, partial [Rhizoclosmatium globosum]